MTPLAAKFAALEARGEKALVLFVTAGDPALEYLPGVLQALEEGGADIIEVGLPFSDPIADGPTIQSASQRALDRGVTPAGVLETLRQCSLETPLVAMGYYNTILRSGLQESAQALTNAGISGTIISDLTPEESTPWCEASHALGLDTVFLAAPTSTDERLAEVCRRATGFVYTVSRTGVTGASSSASTDAIDLVGRLRSCSDLPICVGFGISTPADVSKVCRFADGAVVGSSLVELIHREWNGGQGRERIIEFVRELKAATRP